MKRYIKDNLKKKTMASKIAKKRYNSRIAIVVKYIIYKCHILMFSIICNTLYRSSESYKVLYLSVSQKQTNK